MVGDEAAQLILCMLGNDSFTEFVCESFFNFSYTFGKAQPSLVVLSKQRVGLKVCLRGHCFTGQFSRKADFRGNPWCCAAGAGTLLPRVPAGSSRAPNTNSSVERPLGCHPHLVWNCSGDEATPQISARAGPGCEAGSAPGAQTVPPSSTACRCLSLAVRLVTGAETQRQS